MKPITVLKKLNEADQSWRNKVMESHLENDKNNPVWIIGWVRFGQRRFRVNAKVFMEPSKFGIDGGPTSKLWICDARDNTICNYDRNWDVRPDGRNKEICDEILKYVEDFRTRNPYEINESVAPDIAEEKYNAEINEFRSFIEEKYGCKDVEELKQQLENVTEEDINEFCTDKFYDLETEEDMDKLNDVEEVLRNQYGLLDSRSDDYEEYDDGDTNWAAEEEADADERFENRYMNGGNGATFNESTKTQDFINQVGADTAARRFAGIKGDTMSLDQYEKYQDHLHNIRAKDTSRYDITISYWDKDGYAKDKSLIGRSVKEIAKKFMQAKENYDFDKITDYSDNLDVLLANSGCNNMEEYLEKVNNER